MSAITNKTIHTMLELQRIEGIGEKSIQQIYEFLRDDGMIKTKKKILKQLELF